LHYNAGSVIRHGETLPQLFNCFVAQAVSLSVWHDVHGFGLQTHYEALGDVKPPAPYQLERFSAQADPKSCQPPESVDNPIIST
jgi:hypothetical protein